MPKPEFRHYALTPGRALFRLQGQVLDHLFQGGSPYDIDAPRAWFWQSNALVTLSVLVTVQRGTTAEVHRSYLRSFVTGPMAPDAAIVLPSSTFLAPAVDLYVGDTQTTDPAAERESERERNGAFLRLLDFLITSLDAPHPWIRSFLTHTPLHRLLDELVAGGQEDHPVFDRLRGYATFRGVTLEASGGAKNLTDQGPALVLQPAVEQAAWTIQRLHADRLACGE